MSILEPMLTFSNFVLLPDVVSSFWLQHDADASTDVRVCFGTHAVGVEVLLEVVDVLLAAAGVHHQVDFIIRDLATAKGILQECYLSTCGRSCVMAFTVLPDGCMIGSTK